MLMNGNVQQVYHIAVFLQRSVLGSAVVQGLKSYLEEHALPWVLVSLERAAVTGQSIDLLGRAAAPYQGVIGFLSGDLLTWARGKDCPLIQLSSAGLPSETRGTCILGDDTAIGVMAARHLVEQGFTSFFCYGRWRITVMARRFAAFIAELQRLGHGCQVEDKDTLPRGDRIALTIREDHFADMVRSLPRPVAMFHHQDRAALSTLETCAIQGLRVPQDVAVLGVDDLHDVCQAAQPALSSVALPWQHVGWLAGLHLHRHLSGEPTAREVLVPPLRVVARASTARAKINDPLAGRCLRRLERDFARPLRVAQLAQDLGVDASTVHRHLTEATGAGVERHLHRLRIDHAAELLITTTVPIGVIARRVGYGSLQRFGAHFRQRFGHSPREYRTLGRPR